MTLKQNISIDPLSIEEIIKIISVDQWSNFESISKKRTIIEAQSHNHTIKLLGIDSKRFALLLVIMPLNNKLM